MPDITVLPVENVGEFDFPYVNVLLDDVVCPPWTTIPVFCQAIAFKQKQTPAIINLHFVLKYVCSFTIKTVVYPVSIGAKGIGDVKSVIGIYMQTMFY